MDIRVLIMDVDGTLTDGKIYIGESGEICKTFSIKDGYGIHDIFIPVGGVPVIITGRQSQIVEKRCAELGITEIYQGVKDKAAKMTEVVNDLGVELNHVAYIGDDLNDMQCMKIIKSAGGLVGCPMDATKEVRDYVDFVATANGGNGAVREFIEFIVTRNESNGF